MNALTTAAANELEAAYARTIRRLEALIDTVPGLREVRMLGSLTCPGVSDIDVWFLFEPPFNGKTLIAAVTEIVRDAPAPIDWRAVPISARAALPLLIPDDAASNTAQLPLPRQALAWRFVLIWLPHKLGQLRRILDTNRPPDAAALRILYSLRYSLQQLELTGMLSEEVASSFSNDVQSLRSSFMQGAPIQDRFAQVSLGLLKNLQSMANTPPPGAPLGVVAPVIPVDWATMLHFDIERTQGVSVVSMFAGGALRLMPETLRPVRINVPAAWASVLGGFFRHPTLSAKLHRVRQADSTNDDPAIWLEQVEAFAAVQSALDTAGIKQQSFLAPLLDRRQPRLAAYWRSAIRRWTEFRV